MNKKKIIILTTLLIVVLGIVIVSYNKVEASRFASPVGELKTTENKVLQANINNFMESQKTGYELGKDNYFCSNHLYGYDEQYAYAMVYCSGLIIKSDKEIEQGSAFVAPTRLEYTTPNFRIINYKQPRDGSLYSPTLKKLFPKQFYDLVINQAPTPEIQKMDEEIKSKIKK